MKENVIQIEQPDSAELAAQTTSLAVQCNELQVADKETHAVGLQLVANMKRYKAAVADLFADAKDQAHKAHKSIVAAEKKLTLPADVAITGVTQKCTTWVRGEREKAAAAQRKADAVAARIRYEAEAKARREAARREKVRLEAEAKARAEAEEKRLAEALAAEEAGLNELAQKIIDTEPEPEPVVPEPEPEPEPLPPPPPPVVVAAPEIAKVEGVSTRTTWSAKVHDLHKLVKHISERPHLMHLLSVNQTQLNGMARAMHDDLNLPGVEVIQKDSISVRG